MYTVWGLKDTEYFARSLIVSVWQSVCGRLRFLAGPCAYATVLRLSVVRNVCIVTKRCVI